MSSSPESGGHVASDVGSGPASGLVRRVVSRRVALPSRCAALAVTYGHEARGPQAVDALLRPLLEGEAVEVFVALLLDARHRVRFYVEVSRGTLTSSLVHPREVFGPALREGAAALVVAHNHPSGDCEPSSEDLELTRRLIRAGELLGVPLLDHLVLGDEGRYVSLRERMSFEAQV